MPRLGSSVGSTRVARPCGAAFVSPDVFLGRRSPAPHLCGIRAAAAEPGNALHGLFPRMCGQPGLGSGSCLTPRRRRASHGVSRLFQPPGWFLRVSSCPRAAAAWVGGGTGRRREEVSRTGLSRAVSAPLQAPRSPRGPRAAVWEGQRGGSVGQYGVARDN